MVTSREAELNHSWKLLKRRQTISINDIEELMYQVKKVLMNIRKIEESRDKWRAKYKELKIE